jgi:hypothetical protein
MHQPQRRKEFAPWNAEFRVVIFYWIMAAVWLSAAMAWCIRNPSLESAAVAEGSVLPLFFGFLHFDSARRRRHGSLVEKRVVKRFVAAAPAHFGVEADVILKRLGNVDLLVTFPNGRRCPIEIKSWRSTGSRSRMSRALHQVRQQRDVLLAQNAILWLPAAPNRNARYLGELLLVEGDEHFLIRRLIALHPAI